MATQFREAPSAVSDLAGLDDAVTSAAAALGRLQQADGHWRFALEADATIPAEYVLLRHFLGEPVDAALEARIGRYLRRTRMPSHGGWPLFNGGDFDISATVKAYYALKMIGDAPNAPHMAAARGAILAHGGAAASNVFTRIQLALYGAGPWSEVPTIPPELILLPRWFPIHLSRMSYWSRTVVVPLLVLCALKPLAANPLGARVDELYARGRIRTERRGADDKWAWRVGFDALDKVLKRLEPIWPRRLRRRAIDACTAWTLERLNGEDGLGAIYPAMANAVMMLHALGRPADDPEYAIARQAVELLLVEDGEETYCQPCVSPVWDTSLAAHAMLEAGDGPAMARGGAALDWLVDRQITDRSGDWSDRRDDVAPGGWAFQYRNDHYPDVDDTSVVAMALDRAQTPLAADFTGPIEQAEAWVAGMQSTTGGWGAFDADNEHYYLNNLPFADHGALLDPPTVDVSARCVSLLAQRGVPRDAPPMARALRYIEDEQEADGSWYGRWGVNYVYGTWSVLCALNAAGYAHRDGPMRRGADWLASVQNADGGWGEDCRSYDTVRQAFVAAPSSPSQTAWAVLGLMAAGRTRDEAVERGIAWLLAHREPDGLWGEDTHTGGGFPRVFYLRYHGYSKYFPLWAIARYRNLRRSNAGTVAYGM